MAGTKAPVGPVHFRFGRAAVRYLTHSPNAVDRACLERFLLDLQTRTTHAHVWQTGGSVLVTVCNHVLVFSSDMSRILDVAPAPAAGLP
jgi:hypothetical protein